MATKKTVVQRYEDILTKYALDVEDKTFIEERIEITKKKNAKRGNGELSPKQKEKMEWNEVHKTAILAAMTADTQYTPTDLVKLYGNAEVTSTQKMTPLLTDLVKENRLVKTDVKGRNVYSLPTVAEVAED